MLESERADVIQMEKEADAQGWQECSSVPEAEVAELDGLVAGVVDSADPSAAFAAHARFKAIICKYQEASQLLDPYLEQLIKPMASVLQTEASKGDGAHILRVQGVSRLIEVISNTRGWKTVVKFFPNDAACLEPVTFLLLKVEREGGKKTSVDDDMGGVWEALCILLLWQSMLVLIPFDLATVDTTKATDNGRTSLVDTIVETCKRHLSSSAKTRDMAAILLARLLTRPDTTSHLDGFLDWTGTVLQGDTSDHNFLIPAVVHTLATIFKLGSRAALLPLSPKVWEQGRAFSELTLVQHNALARKLVVKLLQRVALTFLEPRTTSWWYKRSSQSLAETLGGGGPQPGAGRDNGVAEEADSDEFEVVEEIEEAIELLLQGLRAKDTIVRWSSAKGLGRVLGRLPKDLGDEVVTHVMELLVSTEPDSAWHGACLALAELVRRGLLLPNRMPDSVPKIVTALHYDIRRGPHSVGAHVRDAACYVCWAFARAYSPETMEAVAPALAPALLTIACYDREVNCRRAASAAFQEMVGRHGGFPHGIDITTAADYFTLSTRSNAYLKVAPYVAGFPEYRPTLVSHLVDTKLRHWEKTLRSLAASALGALVPSEPSLFLDVIDRLLPLCLDKTLEVRHGACYGIGEVVLAMHNTQAPLREAQAVAVANIVLDIEKARLYRGKGGEIMRAAVCRLLECTALAGVPVTTQQRKKLLDSLEENLRHPTADIQEAAAKALTPFTRAYMAGGGHAAVERTAVKFAGQLHDPNVAVRRGSSLGLGALPLVLVAPKAEAVIKGLCSALQIEEDPDEQDPESRVNAAKVLAVVCELLFGEGCPEENRPDPRLLNEALEALLLGVHDYSVDKRGDVGSWVREAAMASLPVCAQLYLRQPEADRAVGLSFVQRSTAAMLRQAVERIGRLREAAVRGLCSLLQGCGSHVHDAPGLVLVQRVVTSDSCLAGIGSGDSLPELVGLMSVADFQTPIFEGSVASIGGLDHALFKAISKAIMQGLSNNGGASTAAVLLTSCWKRHSRDKRLATPFLKAADLIFTHFDMTSVDNCDENLCQILSLVKEETRGCADVPRLLACATLLCHLVAAGSTVRQPALSSCLWLLGNRFPKVRKFMAEQLYVKLLTLEGEEEGLGQEILEDMLDVLSGTIWDGAMPAVRVARASMYPLLGLEPPKLKPKVSEAAGPKPSTNAENESYASLLADAERGLGSGM